MSIDESDGGDELGEIIARLRNARDSSESKGPYDYYGIECGPGWASLYEPLIEHAKREEAQIRQIKEKFGELRFYVAGASDELRQAIRAAEEKSLTVCEQCGAPGVLRTNGGWRRTLCDTHSR